MRDLRVSTTKTNLPQSEMVREYYPPTGYKTWYSKRLRKFYDEEGYELIHPSQWVMEEGDEDPAW